MTRYTERGKQKRFLGRSAFGMTFRGFLAGFLKTQNLKLKTQNCAAAALLAALLLAGCGGAGAPEDGTPTFEVTSPAALLKAKGPEKLDRLVWEYAAGGEIWGGVGVGRDAVFVGASKGVFAALDKATGAVRWRNDLSKDVFFKGSPIVAGDVVVAGTQNGHLYGFDAATGETLWNVHAGAAFNATNLLAAGVLYAASMEGIVYGFDPSTGREVWRFTSPSKAGFSTRPAVEGSFLYIGDMGRNATSVVAKVSLKTREIEWTALSSEYVMAPPALDRGRLFVTNGAGEAFALDAKTGERLWGFAASYAMNAAPALDGKRLFAGSRDGHVYALDRATGELLWKRDMTGWVESGLVRSANFLYAGAVNVLFALDPETGHEAARYQARDAISSDIALADGVLYFGDMSGNVYAVGDK